MKYFFLILLGMTVLSCKSQTKTDLLALKFDESISGIVQADPQLKKDQDPNLGLNAFRTNQPGNYNIGDIKLSTYSFPTGYPADYNQLYLFVEDKDEANYLGFKYNTVHQEETKAIISYLKKTYPKYEERATQGNGESFFWDLPTLNAWVFIDQGISKDKNAKQFLSTNFIYVKRGTRMENSKDSKVITIKEYDKMMYPDVLK